MTGGENALLALGSSMGDRRRYLELALRILDATEGVEVLRVSRLYRTAPVGGVARGWFLNAVALLRCSLTPHALLRRCQEAERRLGRKPGPRWRDRPIDLDLLAYGQRVYRSGPLVLPHPEMSRRGFVVRPLQDLGTSPAGLDLLRFPEPEGGWRPAPVPVGVLARDPASGYLRADQGLGAASVIERGAPRRAQMQFFLDTANLDEIREAASWGILDGCTTNPSLVAREGRDFIESIHEICEIVDGPVSAEVVAADAPGMVKEGRLLARVHDHVVVKVPLTVEGIKATKALSSEGIRVNVTLCFQAGQAILAAKAGATYISPFIGRLDDICNEGMELVRHIVEVYANYSSFDTQVLVASIRHPQHVLDAALSGADVVTIPFAVLKKLILHPLTDKGNAAFLKDWQSVPDSDIVGQTTRWLERNGR